MTMIWTMAETDERGPRSRGTGFPLIPLPDAVERLTQIGRYGKEHSRTGFAQYLGHKTPDSGPFKRKLAAFRDWSFVTTSANTITLTDLAMRLAMPPDEEAFASDLREAFRGCDPFMTVFDAMAKGVELDVSAIANTAVHRLGVAPAARMAFATSFAKSAVYVGLATENSAGRIELRPIDLPATPSVSREAPGAADVQPSPRLPAPATALQTSMALPWDVEGGRIVLQIDLDHPLPSDAFTEIGRISSVIERLADVLGRRQGVEGAESEPEFGAT